MGAVADYNILPFGAMLIGCVAAVISTAGFEYLKPYMRDRLKTPDTCGVINLHGIPGIFSGLICACICC